MQQRGSKEVRDCNSKEGRCKNEHPSDLLWAFGTNNTSIKKRKTASDKKGDKSNREDGKEDIFAILEFKNTSVLFWDDFKHASYTKDKMDNMLAKHKEIE